MWSLDQKINSNGVLIDTEFVDSAIYIDGVIKEKAPDGQFVQNGDAELFDCLYGNPSEVLSQLTRTAFIAPEGSRFIVADFSAIEARVIAWLADENGE